LTTENHASLDDLEDSLIGRPNVYVFWHVPYSCGRHQELFHVPPFRGRSQHS
jgi:hypothetical protein